jgi:hypothetical protein
LEGRSMRIGLAGRRIPWVTACVIHRRSIARFRTSLRTSSPMRFSAVSTFAVVHGMAVRRWRLVPWRSWVSQIVGRQVMPTGVAARIGSFPLLTLSLQLARSLSLRPIPIIERIRPQTNPFRVIFHARRRSADIVSTSIWVLHRWSMWTARI